MATQVIDLLHELNRQEGQTIVLVTHDPAIGGSAGRVVRMRDGHLIADQRPSGDGQWAADGNRGSTVRTGG
jgi:putative ABC transport system ATP-binding protein